MRARPTRNFVSPQCLALYCLAIFLAAISVGCARQPTSTAEVPRHLSQTYKISVAPFSQPVNPGQLIAGQIPEDQGKVPQDVLLNLDMDLRGVLMSKTSRQFAFIPACVFQDYEGAAHSQNKPEGLATWLAYGKQHGAEYLLVPQVMNWHEREGSQAGVQKSAHVRLEFFLLNVKDGLVVSRSVFEEKQVGLVDNLLGVADFVKRKGQWVTARQLADEAMENAVKEMGL